MAQKDLIPQSLRTKDEQRRIARMGGIASGKARREKRRLRDLLKIAAAEQVTNPTTGEKKCRDELAMARLASKAANGDLKAIELMAKLLGELAQKHELTGADGEPLHFVAEPPKPLTENQIERAINKLSREL